MAHTREQAGTHFNPKGSMRSCSCSAIQTSVSTLLRRRRTVAQGVKTRPMWLDTGGPD